MNDRSVWWWPLVTDAAEDEGALWLRWLVRLRWVAIIAQVVTLSFSLSILATPWLVVPLLLVVAMLALGNLRALQILELGRPVDQQILLAQLAIDVIALTSFFVLAGGPDNPFTVLYVVHVAMAAVMLTGGRAAILVVLVLVCFLVVHVVHLPLLWANHSIPEDTLRPFGRVVAFAIATGSVGTFVVGLASTLRNRTAQLLAARDRTARTDRLRSVGTLAAGAAHELNTPLSTIGLRIRRVRRRHEDADTAKDLDVVQKQLERCSGVVEQLLVGAGDPSASGIERNALGHLVSDGVHLWSKGAEIEVKVELQGEDFEVEVPRVAFTQALINLLQNGHEAQQDIERSDPLDVVVVREGDFGVVYVRDHGRGLPDGQGGRVGDPFFTTKPTGTGLGVFVARAVAEGAGGGLSYAPREGGGTEARWWFPQPTRRSA